MPVTSDFITLANDLVINGYKSASSYVSGLSTQPTFYIVLLNNGSVVAQLPVSEFQYREFSPTEQSLTYTAVDNSNNQYTFNEVQLWAGNQYIITDDTLQQSVTKQSTVPITVTVVVTLETSTNTVNAVGIIISKGLIMPAPVTTFWSFTKCPAICTPMPIQNFIILLLLIPTSYYSKLNNTLFMCTYNQLPLNQSNPLSSINGVTAVYIALPVVNLDTHSSYCTTSALNTPFKPPINTTLAFVGAVEQITYERFVFITIVLRLNTTQYIEFEITTAVST